MIRLRIYNIYMDNNGKKFKVAGLNLTRLLILLFFATPTICFIIAIYLLV